MDGRFCQRTERMCGWGQRYIFIITDTLEILAPMEDTKENNSGLGEAGGSLKLCPLARISFFCVSGNRYSGVQEVRLSDFFLIFLKFPHYCHLIYISAVRLSLDLWSSLQGILHL